MLSDAVGNVTAIYGSDAADEEDTIFARRYPAGGPVADEPVALDTLTGDESRSDTSAAMDADGNFPKEEIKKKIPNCKTDVKVIALGGGDLVGVPDRR